ncbi:hypothetical protein AAG570_004963 [Ranatra chinensis]|uniref:Tim44-like domain-containing protein n=1 Tax=Ranatra chinensis TaxID=642074 RepID=A0ABD0XZ32_9HEMI
MPIPPEDASKVGSETCGTPLITTQHTPEALDEENNVRFASNESPKFGKIAEKFRKAIGDKSKFEAVQDIKPQLRTFADSPQENNDKAGDPQDKSGRDGANDKRDDPKNKRRDDRIFLSDIGRGESERTMINRKMIVEAAPLRALRSRSGVPPGVQTPLPTLSERNIFKSKYMNDPSLFYTIAKLSVFDPTFTDKRFLDNCKNDFIPNIIGAINTQNEDFIDDWSTGGVRQIMYFKVYLQQYFGTVKRLVSVEDVEIVSGRWTEKGPVLTVSFQTRELLLFTGKNKIPEVKKRTKFVLSGNVWDMVRDMSVSDPKAAWRLCKWRRWIQK